MNTRGPPGQQKRLMEEHLQDKAEFGICSTLECHRPICDDGTEDDSIDRKLCEPCRKMCGNKHAAKRGVGE